MNHWTDAHIDSAWDDVTDRMFYTGYDEAGAPIICNENRERVVAHLEAYARRLTENTVNSVNFGATPKRTPTLIHPGDVLCTEYGDFLVVSTNFTLPQQLGLVNLTDHQLIHQTVTGCEVTIDDFAPFLHEADVYQVRRCNTSVPEPTTPAKRYNVSPSGPFRDCNITIKMLDAINRNEFTEAVSAAMIANHRMSVAHAEDFVHYLMED